jgi:hypothetical protein
MDIRTVAEMLAAFKTENAERVENLPKDDPLRVTAQAMGDTFTVGVATLKMFPNPVVRDLASMVWDILGHRIVPIAMGPNVPTLTIAVHGNPALPQAILFVPHRWCEMVKEDPCYQLGAITFVGSQAVDLYNGRIAHESKEAIKRARAYEAEYLRTVREQLPGMKFNEWQEDCLSDFPAGIATPSIVPLLHARAQRHLRARDRLRDLLADAPMPLQAHLLGPRALVRRRHLPRLRHVR